ncbi:YDG domain-containing protein, partial [Pantoea sp. 18069]|uniref:YDG domain-containing protein n=1 Tax=Pantoea sp. 18069 TaxID=2681415 RepID=UPI00190F4AAA
RIYDGTTDATLNTAEAFFDGKILNDVLTVANADGSFRDKNAGDGKTVDITGIALGGADAHNYTLVSTTATATADIAKAEIASVNGLTAGSRIYDGTTDATLSTAEAFFDGKILNDVLTIANADGSFRDKNAGDGKTVDITGIALGGADAHNYTLASTTATATADIAKAEIAGVNGIAADSRIYDGTTDATLNTAEAFFDGKILNDVLTVANADG